MVLCRWIFKRVMAKSVKLVESKKTLFLTLKKTGTPLPRPIFFLESEKFGPSTAPNLFFRFKLGSQVVFRGKKNFFGFPGSAFSRSALLN